MHFSNLFVLFMRKRKFQWDKCEQYLNKTMQTIALQILTKCILLCRKLTVFNHLSRNWKVQSFDKKNIHFIWSINMFYNASVYSIQYSFDLCALCFIMSSSKENNKWSVWNNTGNMQTKWNYTCSIMRHKQRMNTKTYWKNGVWDRHQY